MFGFDMKDKFKLDYKWGLENGLWGEGSFRRYCG